MSVIGLAAFALSAWPAAAAESQLADAAQKCVAPKEQQQTSSGQRPGLTNQNDDEP
jgi:hypothetical protein